MSNATSLPLYASNKFFFWNAKLTDSLDNSTTDQTIYWDTVPVDENGATITGAFLIAVRNTRRNPNRTEMMWVPASAVAADGLSATTVVRGLKPSGIDFTTGSSSYCYEFDSGDEIFCAILPQDGELIRAAIQGLIGSGGTQLSIGDGASGYKTYGVYLDTGFKGVLRGNGTTTQYSNDGTTWISIASVSASNLVAVTSADTTPSYLNDKIDVATGGTLTKSTINPAGNETLGLTLATTLTKAEMDALHTGISANVTGTNLATLTAGAASNADALHTHSILNVVSYTAYEAVTADNAVALLPVETKWFDQLTDTVVNLGETNQLRKYAVKYIPTVSGTLTDWNFRAREAVNGATAVGNLVVTIQTDSGGSPSGTALTNATATISQATQQTWTATMGTRTATFGGSVAYTAGTTYWVVYECSATQLTNYLKFGANNTYVGNYLTFQRLTYDLDTETWGNSSTTSILFGWSNTTAYAFGFAVVPTDADFAARTWNFVGFATSTVSAQASVPVETSLANLSGLITNGKPYYISSTTGAITQTKPTAEYNGTAASYEIGKALSSTQFQIDLGDKFYWGIATAITDVDFLYWGRLEKFEVDFFINTAPGNSSSGSGVYDGTSNKCTAIDNTNGSGAQAVRSSTSNCVDGMVGSMLGSTLTDIGFKLDGTGTPTGIVYTWKAYLA